MPEHQQKQQSKITDKTIQKQTIPPKQIPTSHPAAIIQRARINPKSLTPSDVLQLQGTIGNRAVGRLLSEIGLIPPRAKQTQPVQMQKMPEEEKEPLQGEMAETIQRQEIPGEEEPLQTKRENNTGMSDDLQAGVESLSGIDMSDARAHYNLSKPVNVEAFAYTQGANIHVVPKQERYLLHEAWHMVQQKQNRASSATQMREAEEVQRRVLNPKNSCCQKIVPIQKIIDPNTPKGTEVTIESKISDEISTHDIGAHAKVNRKLDENAFGIIFIDEEEKNTEHITDRKFLNDILDRPISALGPREVKQTELYNDFTKGDLLYGKQSVRSRFIVPLRQKVLTDHVTVDSLNNMLIPISCKSEYVTPKTYDEIRDEKGSLGEQESDPYPLTTAENPQKLDEETFGYSTFLGTQRIPFKEPQKFYRLCTLAIDHTVTNTPRNKIRFMLDTLDQKNLYHLVVTPRSPYDYTGHEVRYIRYKYSPDITSKIQFYEYGKKVSEPWNQYPGYWKNGINPSEFK
jgi:hypothetical protein